VKQLDLPHAELPSAIARAAQVRVDREADLFEAQRELREAQLAVETAIVEDRAAYASSRDAGGDDPEPLHERAAREEVAQAERRERGEALRPAHAQDEQAGAVREHIDGWATRKAQRAEAPARLLEHGFGAVTDDSAAQPEAAR
jgi:hypothetical protein